MVFSTRYTTSWQAKPVDSEGSLAFALCGILHTSISSRASSLRLNRQIQSESSESRRFSKLDIHVLEIWTAYIDALQRTIFNVSSAILERVTRDWSNNTSLRVRSRVHRSP